MAAELRVIKTGSFQENEVYIDLFEIELRTKVYIELIEELLDERAD